MLYWFVMFVFFSLLTPCCVRWAVFVSVLSCSVLLCLYCSVCSLVVELGCVLYLPLSSFV